jgi:plastocyanin
MKRSSTFILGALLLAVAGPGFAAKADVIIDQTNRLMDHGDGHLMNMEGAMIMGQNKDKLPPGCSSISEERQIEVHAGHSYAKDYPGTMFGFSSHEWRVKPCAKLTVTLVNEDHIRHQWMMHGLPKFMYDKGMFHLEVTGPGKISGTLILPSEDKTYLVHCDIAQHMEKGMKGQLIVGNGSTPFPSIPGVTDLAVPDDYGPKIADSVKSTPTTAVAGPAPSAGGGSGNAVFLLGVIFGAVGTPFAINYYRKRFEGMSRDEIIHHLLNTSKSTMDKLLGLLMTLVARFSKK